MKKTLREVCYDTGVSRRAIQGYEKMGLVSAVGKNKYGHLLYDSAGVQRIKTIRFYQQIGFSLKEIQTLLDAPPVIIKEQLCIRAKQLKEEGIELQTLIQRIEQYITQL